MTILTAQTDAAVHYESSVGREAAHGRRGLGVWMLIAAALAAVLAAPFFLVDTPAVLDYPNHLARLFILAHPNDPVLSRLYAPHWRVLPNLGVDVLGAGLLRLVSPTVGGRILLALCLLAPFAGVLVYHRAAFQRVSYWPLAAALAAYNGVFFLGFMNFLLGIGLGLAAAGGWIALRRKGPAWRAPLFGGVASAVLFLCHIFGVAYFALLIGCFELSRLDDMRRAKPLHAAELAGSATLMALALAPAAALYLASPTSGAGGLGPWDGTSKLWGLFTPFMLYSRPLTLLTGAVAIAVVILVWRKAAFAPGVRTALILLATLYVLAPTGFKGGTFIDTRLALMMGLLLFAGIDPDLPRRRIPLFGLAIGALVLLRAGSVAAAWTDHRGDLDQVRAAIAPVQPGARVLVVQGDASGRTDISVPARALPGLYRLDGHLGALLVTERRAFWPLLFADPNQQPVVVRPPYSDIAQPLGDLVGWDALRPAEPTPQTLAAARYLRYWRTRFDYVLLLDAGGAKGPVPSGLAAVRVTPYAALYRVEG